MRYSPDIATSWAKLIRHTFEIAVLTCPRWGGRLRLIATVEDLREIREVVDGLALSTEPVDRAPPCRKSFAGALMLAFGRREVTRPSEQLDISASPVAWDARGRGAKLCAIEP